MWGIDWPDTDCRLKKMLHCRIITGLSRLLRRLFAYHWTNSVIIRPAPPADPVRLNAEETAEE